MLERATRSEPALGGLTPRQRRVLRGVIEGYIARAVPVGSRSLVERSRLGVSSATVRNTMVELEKCGLITHPHRSAGRVPTARGYRLYVDELLAGRAPVNGRARDHIERELDGAPGMRALLERASAALARHSHQLALVWARAAGARVDDLALLRSPPGRVRLVIGTGEAGVRSVELPEPSPGSLDRIREALVAAALGAPVVELADRLRVAALAPELADWQEGLARSVEEADGLESLVLCDGALTMLDQPEFADGARARAVVRWLEESPRRTVLARASQAGLRVWMDGEETSALLGLALVTAPVHAGPVVGTLGVLGPLRMDYRHVVPLVEHVSHQVAARLR